MPILNYTTSISFDKTIAEVQRILVSHGATKIVTDYDEKGLPVAVTFCLTINDCMVAFQLPCNYSGVLRAMERDDRVTRRLCTKEQALRVSWHIVKDWVEAQMAIVEANLAAMAEVFLPYAVTKNGTTLYKDIEAGNSQLLLGQ